MTEKKNLKQRDEDFDFARDEYYKLMDKSQEALDNMMAIAAENEHPRSFEVVAQLLKQNADIASQLLDLQKKKKDISTDDVVRAAHELEGNVTNNLFVGTTAELQKLLSKTKEDSEVSEVIQLNEN